MTFRRTLSLITCSVSSIILVIIRCRWSNQTHCYIRILNMRWCWFSSRRNFFLGGTSLLTFFRWISYWWRFLFNLMSGLPCLLVLIRCLKGILMCLINISNILFKCICNFMLMFFLIICWVMVDCTLISTFTLRSFLMRWLTSYTCCNYRVCIIARWCCFWKLLLMLLCCWTIRWWSYLLLLSVTLSAIHRILLWVSDVTTRTLFHFWCG